MNTKQSRRLFIKHLTLASAAVASPAVLNAQTNATAFQDINILFQGDSITDGNRTRDNDWNHVMGHGYAYLIASRLWFEFPKRKLHFFNRGISGNKIPDLISRWQKDTIELKPDVLSIMIGVNDSLAAINGETGFDAADYEKGYRALLQQTLGSLPSVKLVICEPFILPVGKVKANWERWDSELKVRQSIAKKIAIEFDAIFVPFQKAFNDALKKAPADYWIWDGVHPMPAGHELMAREWLKAVKI